MPEVPFCDAFTPEDITILIGPYAPYPEYSRVDGPPLEPLIPRGGPVQDPVLTRRGHLLSSHSCFVATAMPPTGLHRS